MALPKPTLRGLLASKTKSQLVLASAISFISVAALRLYQEKCTRDVTNNFYKYTDFEAEAQRMKQQNVFRCIGPEGVRIGNYK